MSHISWAKRSIPSSLSQSSVRLHLHHLPLRNSLLAECGIELLLKIGHHQAGTDFVHEWPCLEQLRVTWTSGQASSADDSPPTVGR